MEIKIHDGRNGLRAMEIIFLVGVVDMSVSCETLDELFNRMHMKLNCKPFESIRAFHDTKDLITLYRYSVSRDSMEENICFIREANYKQD